MRFALSRNPPITLRFLDPKLISGVLCIPMKKARCCCNHIYHSPSTSGYEPGAGKSFSNMVNEVICRIRYVPGSCFSHSFALSCFWPRSSYCYFNLLLCLQGRKMQLMNLIKYWLLSSFYGLLPVASIGRCNRFTGKRHVVSLVTLGDFLFFSAKYRTTLISRYSS